MKRQLITIVLAAVLSTVCFVQAFYVGQPYNNFGFNQAFNNFPTNSWATNNWAIPNQNQFNSGFGGFGVGNNFNTGWNNFNPYYSASPFQSSSFYGGNNNNWMGFKSANQPYKQMVTTPSVAGYDVEYEIPGGRAKKYYASQSIVQQVF